MKNTSFIFAYCLIIVCGIFSLCSNLSFAEATPMVTATPVTTPTPQSVITREATNITSNSATLNATVYFGAIQSMFFEYGTASGSYTSSVGAVREDLSEKVSADISGLLSATTYYDRIVIVTKPPPDTGYTYGNEESFTTLAATPTPECEAESIEAFPKTLKLQKDESGDVTVTVTCADSSPVVGETVTAKIKSGKKRISISPQSTDTNVNGQAIFTITATKKTGNAKVKFGTASGLKTTVTVKVRR